MTKYKTNKSIPNPNLYPYDDGFCMRFIPKNYLLPNTYPEKEIKVLLEKNLVEQVENFVHKKIRLNEVAKQIKKDFDLMLSIANDVFEYDIKHPYWIEENLVKRITHHIDKNKM